ncbi:hypothetical protein GGR50DRAFT_639532 [Xylaria sp. CBS 124048]|nr:hypothetical protein GGR50DRAFT_639532 [Xylaria sp. CBS 124048]
MSPSKKQQISWPIEAGRSILDTHNLPPNMTCVLEYVSKRLARRRLHVTLVVVKHDYQLPATLPCTTPSTPPYTIEHNSVPSDPASTFRFKSPAAGLRQLVRRGTGSSSASATSKSSRNASETSASVRISPTFPPPPTSEPPSSPRRWILPLRSGASQPPTPMTPRTPSSIATMTTSSSSGSNAHRSQSPEAYWVRLIYASPVSPRDDRMIRATMIKAEHKFHTKAGSLPAITTPEACGLNADLVWRSIQQNEVLFSSEGLTLMGLDRLYSFKAALTAYTKSIGTLNPRAHISLNSPGLSNHPVNRMPPTPASTTGDSLRLEDAVDSLRRLVLSHGDRPLSKADLYRSFDWLGVNPTALADVERMYRRAYGGPDRRGAFEAPLTIADEEYEKDCEINPKRTGFVKIGSPPPPKSQTMPVLKVNTNIRTSPRFLRPKPEAAPVSGLQMNPVREARVEHGNDKTRIERHDAKDSPEITLDGLQIVVEQTYGEHLEQDDDCPTYHIRLRDGPWRQSMWFSNTSIDDRLSPSDERYSQALGPVTPNGYDDISPITRGEWGFLFKGDTWTQPRTAVVETC